ncbi:flagellar basal-body rod protein FlgG [Buchnera aphidicola (Thelaxes californica)]|uniref:Flagellar basal-body rod protein FlgG n=1 Tax=Buchnera aphidicola (Thelaxes californica) TaxID=1315998 RepID=A0A4D6YAG1_9GAMM|nr:flagellar basal-body rod protein FlgG [Buchnera aphidicola]QCI26797.1 flagellar basal-body rod protein FlgG [Buchnera aphidicola (Thelaxes californica)]
MFSSLWISKTGLDAQQINMNVISNNLANVSTNGFKKSRGIFEDLLYQNIRYSGLNSTQDTIFPVGFQVGTGVGPVATERVHSQGNLLKTDSNKDIAINGKGFFQVLLTNEKFGYTRDGSFQINKEGKFVTNSGFVIQPEIKVPPDTTKISIGKDGIVTAVTGNKNQTTELGQLNIVTFLNDVGLESIGENLYQETNASGVPKETTPGTNGSGFLYQGYVETSNVNVAEELINMIHTQRAYEINSKAINTSDQMLQRLSQL